MYLSINELSQLLGMDRQTITKRLNSVGLEPKPGPKNAHLYRATEAISVCTFTFDECCEANVMRSQVHKAMDEINALEMPDNIKSEVKAILETALSESDRLVDELEDQRWVKHSKD